MRRGGRFGAGGRTTTGYEALAAMICAFVNLAGELLNIYRFCQTAVNRFAPEETGGFFNSIAALLAERLADRRRTSPAASQRGRSASSVRRPRRVCPILTGPRIDDNHHLIGFGHPCRNTEEKQL